MSNPARFVLLALALGLAAAPVFAADAPVPPTAADSDAASLKQQLADVRDQLATALHSYALLEDENRQLKADAEKSQAQLADDQRAIVALKAQVPLAAQAETLRTQVRQLQDEGAALAEEVLRLKTRLALAGAPPAAGSSSPSRPAR